MYSICLRDLYCVAVILSTLVAWFDVKSRGPTILSRIVFVYLYCSTQMIRPIQRTPWIGSVVSSQYNCSVYQIILLVKWVPTLVVFATYLNERNTQSTYFLAPVPSETWIIVFDWLL